MMIHEQTGTDIIGNIEKDINYLKQKNKNENRRIFIKHLLSKKVMIFSGLVITTLIILIVITPILAKYSPIATDPVNRMRPPDGEHWFGTDTLGRDVFSRVLYGARISMQVGILVALVSGVIGTLIGLLSAFYKAADNVLMRIMDGFMVIPDVLLAIALVAALGASTKNIVIACSVIFIPMIARTVRSSALTVLEQPYIEVLKALGSGSMRILWIHVLPNCLSPLLVQVTYVFSYSIIMEASLSFLGAGTPAPAPSWGSILQDGVANIQIAWWLTVFPGAFMLITILAINLVGDGIRDMFDPNSDY